LKTITTVLILIALLYLSKVETYAQGKTSILTKNIENHFTMYKKPLLCINTERGIITIKGWYHAEIKVVLKLTAKNADPLIAQKELDQMKYSITKTYNSVYLNNQMVLLRSNQEVSSVITAEYEIYVPYETNLRVYNQFGKVEIENVKGSITGELHYSDLTLNNKTGVLNLFITIGDFKSTKSNLTGVLNTRHSNISIKETAGKLQMESEYGNIRITYGAELFNLSLKSNATEINIENKSCYPLELNLEGLYCPLKISDNCFTPEKSYLKSDYQPDSEQEFWKLTYIPPDKATKLIISSKFGSLNMF